MKWTALLTLVCALSWSEVTVQTQQLAFHTYQVSDGLPHGLVISLHQDAKGYLWLATYEGLSRFDGYRFTNYGAAEGLGHAVVNDVLSDRHGQIWVALNGAGVARLIDTPTKDEKKFKTFLVEADQQHSANAVNRILFDAENRLWAVTDAGLYRARQIDVGDAGFERVAMGSVPYFNNAAFADSHGRLWFGVGAQIVQVAKGRLTGYWPARDAEPSLREIPREKDIHSLVEDQRGRILAAESTGLFEFVESSAGESGTWRGLPLDLPPVGDIRAIIPASGGGLWIGTTAGLIRYNEGRSRLYTTNHGLSGNQIRALLRDREDNLWIATEGSGVSKLSGEGIVSYTTLQGLPSPEVYRLTEDRDGRIYATVGCAPRALVLILDDRVSPIPGPRFAASQCYKSHLVRDALGNTWYHTKSHVVQDARGNWWFHTPRGLEFSFGPQLRPQDTRLVGVADGFPEGFYTEMYEDTGGNIWIVNGLSGNLYVADRQWKQRPRFRFVTSGLKNAEFLLRDRAGTLWIASSNAIWRLSNGKLLELQPSAGLPAIEPRALFQDTQGRLWIGLRYHGVSMTIRPDMAEPQFVNYTTANGLASDTVWSIAEDDHGHLYLGTGRGLDQLDAQTQQIRHLTAETGVVGSVIEDLLKDRRGRIWIASDGGITQLDPRAIQAVTQSPPIFITSIQVAGEEWPLPVTGAQRVPAIELPSSRNTVMIQFVGLSHRSENPLRYQYKLDDAGSDWSMPSDRREVNFAGLSPGQYRFVARAVSSQNVPSAQPARVEFVILPPLYLRWWFIGLSALCLAWLTYAAYRYRLARLLEVANVRTRIATDLHDDIGANLTRIAILSEVARQAPGNGDKNADAPLASIASIARESVAAMSDIVWAITPDRDALHHLVGKMRNYAEELFEARDIALALNVPDGERPLKLGVNVRRDLYLIFKEALNNVARHSRCSRVSIDFHIVGSHLCLEVVDDGVGFDQAAESDGHGLTSMQRRAARLGATLNIGSRPGQGTTVSLTMPTGGSRFGLRRDYPHR